MKENNIIPITELTAESTNDMVKKSAFKFVHDIGYMIFSTVDFNGMPAARGLEVHYLDATETFYIGMAPGKPVYHEIKNNPHVCGVIVALIPNGLSVSVRINAHVREIDPQERPDIYEKYWELNPGTHALYIKDLERFRIFVLDHGEGQVFYMPEDDIIHKNRFSFGGDAIRAWAYEIDANRCLGCGTCEALCMEGVIHPTENGKYQIDHFGCLECGRCLDYCPSEAIITSGIKK